MKILLKLKHWQLFPLLILTLFISNFTWVGFELLNTLLTLTGFLIYMIWYFVIGMELTEYLPNKIVLGRTIFIINGFVLLVSTMVLVIFFDGSYSTNSFIGFVWIVYLIYAIFQFFMFPAKVLKTIELKREATLGDYLWCFLLMIFWPAGVWWIQPKLNRIIKEVKAEEVV